MCLVLMRLGRVFQPGKDSVVCGYDRRVSNRVKRQGLKSEIVIMLHEIVS